MVAVLANRRRSLAGREQWALSSLRPVTLLIGCGIVLIAALLIATGLAAGRLREQALARTQTELSRLDFVLAEQGNYAFQAVDLVLRNVAGYMAARHIDTPAAVDRDMAGQPLALLLQRKIDGVRELAGLMILDADGRLVNVSGAAPAAPADLSDRDYFRALRASPARRTFVGAPRRSPRNEAWQFTLARRLTGPDGQFLGVVVGTMPVRYFTDFYRTVALGLDSSVSLVRRDAMLLARYPAVPKALGQVFPKTRVADILAHGGSGDYRAPSPVDGQWKLKSIHPLNDYPVGVLVTRSVDGVLAVWAHQMLTFVIFALAGCLAIVAMIMLMARQLNIHATLAATRAEKLDAEHARLLAEAELLKKERLSVLGQLTATVAHELRNPLSAIRNTLFSIKEMAATKNVTLDRPVARMERSIERCDRIIADLLEYTKTRELRCTLLGFDHWLDDVLGDQRFGAEIVILKEFGAPDAVVPIDGDRMRRVVINLVENAAQALVDPQAKCPEKRITVRTRLADGMLELAILDTGPGIPEENLSRIFEPLFSTKSFGTGLGLATVRQIVIQHAGTIRIDSTPGAGTGVFVHLPLGGEARAAA
jgi:signal transduction histidine kinase